MHRRSPLLNNQAYYKHPLLQYMKTKVKRQSLLPKPTLVGSVNVPFKVFAEQAESVRGVDKLMSLLLICTFLEWIMKD